MDKRISSGGIWESLLIGMILLGFAANFSSHMYQALCEGTFNPIKSRQHLVPLKQVDGSSVHRYVWPPNESEREKNIPIGKEDFFEPLKELDIQANPHEPFVTIYYKTMPPNVAIIPLMVSICFALVHGVYLYGLASTTYFGAHPSRRDSLEYMGVMYLSICYVIGFLYLISALKITIFNFDAQVNIKDIEKYAFLSFYFMWFLIDSYKFKNSDSSYERSHHDFWRKADGIIFIIMALILFLPDIEKSGKTIFKTDIITIKDLAVFVTLLIWLYMKTARRSKIKDGKNYVKNYEEYLDSIDVLGKDKLSSGIISIIQKKAKSKINILDFGCGDGKRLEEFIEMADIDKTQLDISGYDIRMKWKRSWDKRFDSAHWLKRNPTKYSDYDIVHASNVLYQRKTRKRLIKKFSNSSRKGNILAVRGYEPGTLFYRVGVSAHLHNNYAWETLVKEEASRWGLKCLGSARISQVYKFEESANYDNDRIQIASKMISTIVQDTRVWANVEHILQQYVASRNSDCGGSLWSICKDDDLPGYIPAHEKYILFCKE